MYYLNSRYYDPETGRFISPADISELNPEVIGGLNLYSYANNNPIAIKYDNSVSGFCSEMVSYIGFGASSTVVSCVSYPTVPEWIKLIVGAIPDLKTGLNYLKARGTKSSFAYTTKKHTDFQF